MTTCFAFRTLREFAMVGACTKSFGTTRKKVVILPSSASLRVAEPDTDASGAPLEERDARAPPGSSTARPPRGCSVRVAAGRRWSTSAPESWVSLWTILILTAVVLLCREPRAGELLLPEERRRAGERALEADARRSAQLSRERRGRGGRSLRERRSRHCARRRARRALIAFLRFDAFLPSCSL